MRLDASNSALCVIDVQERLLPAMAEGERVVARCRRLVEAAGLLAVPTLLTEQYPQGLGPTVASLAGILPKPVTKMSFSCWGTPAFRQAIPDGVSSIVLCGLETHVCVAQTAIDLLAGRMAVFIAVDAMTSRHPIDHETALRRLEAAGAMVTTSEAVLFEWCGSAEHPQFQAVRKLVRA